MICLMPKPSQSFFVYHIRNKEKIFTEKELFKEKGELKIEQKKRKEGFLTALAMGIEDLTTSITKYGNEFESPRENCEDSN